MSRFYMFQHPTIINVYAKSSNCGKVAKPRRAARVDVKNKG